VSPLSGSAHPDIRLKGYFTTEGPYEGEVGHKTENRGLAGLAKPLFSFTQRRLLFDVFL
jgi:hypothetical protein